MRANGGRRDARSGDEQGTGATCRVDATVSSWSEASDTWVYAITSKCVFQLMKVIDALNDQVTKKGIEINEYKEKHNIRIRGQDDLQQQEEDNNNKEDKRKAIVVNPIEI